MSSVATVATDIEHGVAVAAEDLLSLLHRGEELSAKFGPGALAALAVLAKATDTALTSVELASTQPLNITLDSAVVASFKAEWAAVVAGLATLGIKL